MPGLEVANTYAINEYEAIDGVTPYELVVNGESAMVGMGSDGEAFLDAGIFLEEAVSQVLRKTERLAKAGLRGRGSSNERSASWRA